MDRAWLRRGVLAAVAGSVAAAGVWAFVTTGRSEDASRAEILQQAEERLVGHCMGRHGFGYAAQPPPAPAEREFPYVVDDVAWARTYGYGTTFDRPDPNADTLAKLSPERQRAWRRTLTGSGSRQGCAAEAKRTLYGDLARWSQARQVVDHVDSQVRDTVTADSRYRVGIAAWARCVDGHGHAASSPNVLRARVTSETRGQPVERIRAREIAAAEAEAACAISAGVPTTVRSLEQEYRPRIEARFARELKTLKVLETRAIPAASRTWATTGIAP